MEGCCLYQTEKTGSTVLFHTIFSLNYKKLVSFQPFCIKKPIFVQNNSRTSHKSLSQDIHIIIHFKSYQKGSM